MICSNIDNVLWKVYNIIMSEIKNTDSLYEHLDSTKLKGLSGVYEIENTKDSEYCSHLGRTVSKFIEIDGKKYFVKYPALGGFDYEIFVELFVSFIAKKVGIDCIDTKLLIDHKTKAIGVISPDFGKHATYACFGEQIGTCGAATTTDDIIKNIENRIKDTPNLELDKQALTNKLNKMICFDYLTKQSDRHNNNFAFVMKENKDKYVLDLAPMYDNGNAFFYKTKAFYRMNPNDCKVYGVEQQKLLNTQYKEMLTWFEQTFSDEKFAELMEEFDSQYGLKELFGKDIYLSMKDEIQSVVIFKIKNCHLRENNEEYIPFEVVYAVMKRHANEINEDEIGDICSKLSAYFSDDEYSANIKNFNSGKRGEISIWKYYDECKKLALDNDNPEIKLAHDELQRKRLQYYSKILEYNMERKFVVHSFEADINYLFFDRDYMFKEEKRDKNFVQNQGMMFVCEEYPLFKELQDWIESVKHDESKLSNEDKKLFKQTEKILKKYIKYVNSFTNKKLNETEKSRLINFGLELDGKFGVREVAYEN